MRMDAKIGFAIGGVLLAVLTVYVLVVPSHKRSAHSVTLAVPSGGDTAVSIPPAPAPMASTDTARPDTTATPNTDKSNDPRPAVAHNDGVNWEKILGGQSDAPTVKTSTPTEGQAASPAVDPNAVASNMGSTGSAPSSGVDMPLAAVAPAAPAASDPPAPVQAASPATQPSGSHLYTIKSGETLSTIAAQVYGNSRFYVAIKRANPSIDPNHLKPGMRITLPDISDVKPGGASAETASGRSTGKTYTVQSGDTLYRISKNLYGSPRQAEAIYELNKESIGADRAKLRLGMVLRLPAGASAVAAASVQ